MENENSSFFTLDTQSHLDYFSIGGMEDFSTTDKT